MAGAAALDQASRRPRNAATRMMFIAALCFAFCSFTALGIWQLYRLQWKLDLIERVESRVHAMPAAPPAMTEWSQINAANDEYRHVRLQGQFIANHDTRVQALTALGAGFWVMTPFQLHDGGIVLVNRGYVPSDNKAELPFPVATSVTGLLRISEPGGGFLRDNAPADNRWYSRDVSAIASARYLSSVAPFFIDADAVQASDAQGWPRGGLTVTRFSNNHLSYALTWFGLALMVAWAIWRVAVSGRKLQH